MAYVIREERPGENLFLVNYYDNELDEERTCSIKFETAEIAEKYGKEVFEDEYSCRTSFRGIEMEGGHPTDAGDNILYIDCNHPGELYYVPAELKSRFERWGLEDGLCLRVVHWKFVKNTYDIVKVSLDDEEDGWCPFKFERTPGKYEDATTTYENDEDAWDEAAEKYPLTEEQAEQKAAIEAGDDMAFFTYEGKRFYYDNDTEYVKALEELEDKLYLEWEPIKNHHR